jgi:hypothetical protein
MSRVSCVVSTAEVDCLVSCGACCGVVSRTPVDLLVASRNHGSRVGRRMGHELRGVVVKTAYAVTGVLSDNYRAEVTVNR